MKSTEDGPRRDVAEQARSGNCQETARLAYADDYCVRA